MRKILSLSAILLASSTHFAFAQSPPETAIPGGDQFLGECAVLLPDSLRRAANGAQPEGIPGGDQFDRNAIPGGDQFDPTSILGGDQFVLNCMQQFRIKGLLIPGGDQFDPKAFERLGFGELKIDDELPEGIPGGDQFDPENIANGGGLGFDPSDAKIDDELPEGIPGGDEFDPRAIPGGDQFDPADAGRTMTGDIKIDDELPEGDVVPVPVPADCDWTGKWGSTYGSLWLIQDGGKVYGDYGVKGFIEGRVGAGCTLSGTFDNRKEELKGRYTFERDGETFQGEWGLEGAPLTESWKGRRSSAERPELRGEELWAARCNWTGTWRTPFSGARMKLIQEGERVVGELGARESIEGTTDVSCSGNRDTRMEATLKDRETGATRSMTITMTERRYVGTIGGRGEGLPSSNIMAGSRMTRHKPELSFTAAPSASSPISDAGGEIEPVGVPGERNEEASEEDLPQASDANSKIARFQVNLGSVCVAEKPVSGSLLLRPMLPLRSGYRFQGLIWAKARAYNQRTGKEVELAPVGGFPNVNGDKERAWEIRQTEEVTSEAQFALASHGCTPFSKDGFAYSASSEARYLSRPPLTFLYEVDTEDFGYASVEEFFEHRRNKIRLMYKLNFVDSFGEVLELGTKAKSHLVDDAPFCGTCNMASYRRNDASIIIPPEAGYPTGDGVLTGFRAAGEERVGNIFVLYDVKRLDE